MKEINPNLFLIDQPHNPPSKGNTIRIKVQKNVFQDILDGREDTEYLLMDPDNAMKYLALSEDETFFVNPALESVPEDITIGDFNGGIFPFQPRYIEYVEYSSKGKNGIEKLLIKVNAMAFEPELMPDGEPFRYNGGDLPDNFNPRTEEEFYQALYNPDGRYTNWTMLLHLGDII